MPEDQGVNGDRWTEQASKLLQRLGWEKVADSNIDIEGEDGHMHGIDALFKYYDGARLLDEGVFLEAKTYLTESFRFSKLQDWVTRLDEKINTISRSSDFYNNYPAMEGTKLRNGILVLWFNDTSKYRDFKPKLSQALAKVKVPQSRKPKKVNRLFILSNDDILRLVSLINILDKWNFGKLSNNSTEQSIRIVYPSIFKNPVQEVNSLHIEYIYSKFVIACGNELREGSIRDVKFLFYFGKHDFDSYLRLRDCMLAYNFLNKNNRLYIYQYIRDDNFRKIETDIRKLFADKGYPMVEFNRMEVFGELPSWMYEK